MKIQLWSVGKAHETYMKAGIEDFTARINKYFHADWKIIAPPKNAGQLGSPELKKQESKSILQQLTREDYLVLLDERGKQFSSPQLAAFIQQRANESSRRLVFLVGGAYGVDDSVSLRADYTWSLSQLVFPHMLVRLIIAEQVYRACTILKNEKYHHS